MKYVFYLLCLLIPFENTALRSLAGVFTAPGAILIIPILLLSAALNFKKINIYEQKFMFVLAYYIIYSLIISLLFSIDYNYYFVLDRGVRFFLLVAPTVVVFFTVIRQTETTLNTGVMLITAVSVLSLLINLVAPDIVNNQSFIQYSSALSPHRMRGFTLEASTFGFQIIVVMLLLFIVIKLKMIVAIPILILIASITVSKGTLLCLVLSCFVYMALSIRSGIKYVIFLSSLIVLPFIFSDSVYSLFASDIENYSSVATRGTMLFTSIVILFKYPLGAGFFGYLPAIYENGFNAIELYQAVFPVKLNFHEVLTYFVVGATEGVSTKTFFFDWVIFAGLPFVVAFMCFNRFLYKSFYTQKQHLEIICLFFLNFSLMTYMPLEGRYIAPFAFAFLFFKAKSKTNQAYEYSKSKKFIRRKLVW